MAASTVQDMCEFLGSDISLVVLKIYIFCHTITMCAHKKYKF